MDNIGIIESLLFTVGDEGLEAGQLADILKMDLDELDQLISTYHSKGLEIQRYGSIYMLTSKRECTFYRSISESKANMKLSQAAMEHYRLLLIINH